MSSSSGGSGGSEGSGSEAALERKERLFQTNWGILHRRGRSLETLAMTPETLPSPPPLLSPPPLQLELNLQADVPAAGPVELALGGESIVADERQA